MSVGIPSLSSPLERGSSTKGSRDRQLGSVGESTNTTTVFSRGLPTVLRLVHYLGDTSRPGKWSEWETVNNDDVI